MLQELVELLNRHQLVFNCQNVFRGDNGLYHFVYVTVNIVNQRYYVGKRSTDNLDDGYLGSGAILSRAVLKYGSENFIRYELKFFYSPLEAFAFEEYIVDSEVVSSENCYNIACGGSGAAVPSISGTVWIFNPLSEEEMHYVSGKPIPDGWKLGRKPGILAKRATLTGKIWITDTNQNMVHDPSEDIPKGWKRGKVHQPYKRHIPYEEDRRRFCGGTMTGKEWVTNPKTGENKFHVPGVEIPQGWKKGRSVVVSPPSLSGKIWITNRLTGDNRTYSPDEELPCGWVRGRTIRRRKS